MVVSTTKSEHVAACFIAKEVIWFCKLLFGVGYLQEEPASLYCDNQYATWFVLNPKFHQHKAY
jgi:hypothetical protein